MSGTATDSRHSTVSSNGDLAGSARCARDYRGRGDAAVSRAGEVHGTVADHVRSAPHQRSMSRRTPHTV